MKISPTPVYSALAQANTAPQHGPRPLPLFLDILWRETENDPELRRRAFQGLRKYQTAQRPARPPAAPAVAAAGNARLLRYGTVDGRPPVVFVPSLINPPTVLDLSESRSMLRHMAAQGHDVHLVDWGTPTAEDSMLGLDGHVADRLVPMLASLSLPPLLVGYCLGGSLVLGAAMLHPVRAIATIAAPWNFDGFPQSDLDQIAGLWKGSRATCERLGYVPMEVLQSGFWNLDPVRIIQKFADFLGATTGTDDERAFLSVEDWANEGAPLTFAAGRDLFETFYGENRSGLGCWMIQGRAAKLESLTCPTLSICSATDRIVPAAASPRLAQCETLQMGHVGMIVGRQAPELLWNPLSQWLSGHSG